MPFEVGNQEAKKADHRKPRVITQKLIAELQHADGAKLQRIVTALVNKAADGDVPALKEIFDRVEGKVAQTVANDDEGAFKIEVSWQPARS